LKFPECLQFYKGYDQNAESTILVNGSAIMHPKDKEFKNLKFVETNKLLDKNFPPRKSLQDSIYDFGPDSK